MGYVIVTHAQKRRKKVRLFRFLGLILLFIIGTFLVVSGNIYWKSMIPTIIEIAQTRISAQTLMVVNHAVATALTDYVSFDSLLKVERDSAGNIVLLSPNTAEVNALARRTAMLSQGEIDKLAKEEIDIPFGTISGIPLLTEKGPEVTITVTPIGSVNCNFSSTFESVGINQTLHRIFINVDCKVDLIIPTSHSILEMSIPVLVCESVIVGSVPNTYLQGGMIMGGYGAQNQ